MAVVALAWGVPEKHLVVKQVNAGCKRDVVVPEEDVVGKQNGTCCNPDGGVLEEDVVGKQRGAVRIGSRMWPQ